MKKIVTLMFVALFALVLVGCGDSGATLKSIRVGGKAIVKVGETETFTATFDPADFKDQAIEWSTSDETALSIDQTGKASGLKAADQVYVFAQSKAVSSVRGQKKVQVKAADDGGKQEDYPDLQGYTIKIAQAEHALQEFDPFLDLYTQADKQAKMQAWEEVEEDFNCQIEVVAYPSSAEWGPSRWAYILSQAQMNTADYDFYTVPDSKIPEFVEGGALISLEDFYVLHGNNMMDPSFITSGSYQGNLYAVGNGDNNIYSVLYYNIGLLEELQKADPTLKEPAEIFNDGDWTFDAFKNYCLQVQEVMAKAYGAEGTAGDASQKYYACSGWDSYYWVGLASNDGEPLADTQTMAINIDTPHKKDAAEVVKYIYENNLADPKQSVDQAVQSWNDGVALFNTGDLWFVGADNRWSKDLWGEDTRYGYVPWPRHKDIEFSDIRVALGGTATWVMPIGRDYSQYGEDCNPENIYWALAEMLQRSEKYYKEDPSYNEDLALQALAAKYAHSEASQQAYIHMQNVIKAGKGYFDPLVVSDNSVGSLYTNSTQRLTIKGAVTQYCFTKAVGDWQEAIVNLLPVLQESLRKAYS
jgi:hypothetical protein